MKLLVFILAILALGCTETVYEEVEKIVYRDKESPKDSVTVNLTGKDVSDKIQFTGKTFIGLDTTSTHVCVDGTDTVFVAVIDSVFIYVPVPGETVFKIIETFRDTFPYFPTRTVYFVPTEVQPIVNAFFAECAARGLLVQGGNLFVTIWPDDDFPPANRSSRTFTVWAHGQYVIQVVSWVDYPHYFTCIFRELAHIQLGKPYTNDPDDMMNPAFPPTITLDDPNAQSLINKLFAQ